MKINLNKFNLVVKKQKAQHLLVKYIVSNQKQIDLDK